MTGKVLDRILYVEDDPDIRTIGTFALAGVGGLTVRACGSGAEALEAVAGFVPDLILLDVMMPTMDGLATLAGLRAIPVTAAAPVVFMTAKVQARELIAYQAMGIVDVIAKPFDPMTLASRIREIYERAG